VKLCWQNQYNETVKLTQASIDFASSTFITCGLVGNKLHPCFYIMAYTLSIFSLFQKNDYFSIPQWQRKKNKKEKKLVFSPFLLLIFAVPFGSRFAPTVFVIIIIRLK